MGTFPQLSKLGQKVCPSQPASSRAKLWAGLGTYEKICDGRESLLVKERGLSSTPAAASDGLVVRAANHNGEKSDMKVPFLELIRNPEPTYFAYEQD